MPKKGVVNNPKGRTKGAQGKVSSEIRERFKEFVDGNFHNVQDWLDRVAEADPDKALSLYLQFSERIIGKVSSVDITSNGKTLNPPAIIQLIGSPPTED